MDSDSDTKKTNDNSTFVSSEKKSLPPGGTLGILGGGQLGRMLASEARKAGCGVIILDPQPDCPAADLADSQIVANYDDPQALEILAGKADLLTFEFENVNSSTLLSITNKIPVRPNPAVLNTCQHREREKIFLRDSKIPCADFRIITQLSDLENAIKEIGTPCVLKTAAFGYDGRGQFKINQPSEAQTAWETIGQQRSVLEAWIPYTKEFSILCARSIDGDCRNFPAAENHHSNHILDVSKVPADLPAASLQTANDCVKKIAQKLDVVGLIAAEFFLLASGEVLVNELAPRPHNSAHYTQDACRVSQFEQHLRAVCGWPLGDTSLIQPVIMQNLLGDLWQNSPPAWERLLEIPQLSLHLYGKKEARPGRKMGHLNITASSSEEALTRAHKVREILGLPPLPFPEKITD
ncbi:MAG: 5-(carboxyamino)imidazole ribonucleotide synthase [Chthoniobacterales bacterium]